jgi:hypothetical protein
MAKEDDLIFPHACAADTTIEASVERPRKWSPTQKKEQKKVAALVRLRAQHSDDPGIRNSEKICRKSGRSKEVWSSGFRVPTIPLKFSSETKIPVFTSSFTFG